MTPALRRLRGSLVGLALAPADQLRAVRPGCVACELLSEFGWAAEEALADPGALGTGPAEALRRLDARVDALDGADFECWNDAVVLRPAWAELRRLARGALDAFGWEAAPLPEYTEVAPGVWRRPAPDLS